MNIKICDSIIEKHIKNKTPIKHEIFINTGHAVSK